MKWTQLRSGRGSQINRRSKVERQIAAGATLGHLLEVPALLVVHGGLVGADLRWSSPVGRVCASAAMYSPDTIEDRVYRTRVCNPCVLVEPCVEVFTHKLVLTSTVCETDRAEAWSVPVRVTVCAG